MTPHTDHRKAMMADLLLDMIGDPFTEPSEISDTIIGELREIHDYHAKLAEKTAKVISFLGG